MILKLYPQNPIFLKNSGIFFVKRSIKNVLLILINCQLIPPKNYYNNSEISTKTVKYTEYTFEIRRLLMNKTKKNKSIKNK